MSEDDPQPSFPAATADAELRSLDRLVGTWEVTGEAVGRVRFERAEGGFFLIQHFDLVHGGRAIKGVEIIGRQRGLGEEPSAEIRSRVHSFLDGLTLEYVYELKGDTLTIWGGKKGALAFYQGRFDATETTLTGGWTWPGGGYKTTTRRIGAR